jgi:Leucine-rich repeat (LRR) protein
LSNNGFSGEISKNLSKLMGFIESKNDSSRDQITTLSDRIQLFTSVFDVELNLTFENNKYIFSGQTLSTTTALNLENNNLSGSIPGDIVNLHQLRQLNLAGNALSGDIPDAPSALPNLESLDLSHNQLVGNVPSMLATSSHYLAVLKLAGNNLSGEIPQVNNFDDRFDNSSYLPGNTGLCGWYTHRCSVTVPSSNNPPGLASKESWVKSHVSIPGFVLGVFTGFLGVTIFIRSVEPRGHPTGRKSARSRYN